eukprot:TRINITY_DN4531_c0_g2_i1.p1 TRINITY_DN4531_c0_g2~~TRINITY_DN4531_c0_g2_i1.p1  ORF type:complete len:294 (+),score=73.30 TRINITY_DN4531_c0_g2_i1:207-1088(+)
MGSRTSRPVADPAAKGLLDPASPFNEELRSRWKPIGSNPNVDLDKELVSLDNVIGSNGRSKLGGNDRVAPYQIVLSFPGAQFSSGTKTDMSGLAMESGQQMAVEVHAWLADEFNITKHPEQYIYFDYHNLQFVPDTYAVTNYKNRGGTAHLNTNWNFYYVEAQLECKIMLVLVSLEWMESPWCRMELETIVRLTKMAPDHFEDRDILISILDEGCYQSEYFPEFKAQCDSAGIKIRNYFEGMSAEEKEADEEETLAMIRKRCVFHKPGPRCKKTIAGKLPWGPSTKVDGVEGE